MASLVPIIMGSHSDMEIGLKIKDKLMKHFGILSEIRICSAHKACLDLLEILKQYEKYDVKVYITIAGKSNALSALVDGNTTKPVISCPPLKDTSMYDIYSSIAAVGLGVKIIEKHVYLDDINYGPDKDVSINFKKFKEMASAIRKVEKSLGAEKKIYKNEIQITKWARRSIVSTKNIIKGQKLTRNNVFSKRPGIGIPSYNYFKILGKKAKKNIRSNSLIKFNDLK